MIALGLHRPMTEAELRESVGAEVYEKVRVINHDAEDVVYGYHSSRHYGGGLP